MKIQHALKLYPYFNRFDSGHRKDTEKLKMDPYAGISLLINCYSAPFAMSLPLPKCKSALFLEVIKFQNKRHKEGAVPP